MSDLAAFQDWFSRALHHSDNLNGNGDAEALRIGLSVHRNTVYKALIDALRTNYPTVERLVGEEWFAASAYAFLAESLPEEPTLSAFGAPYPDFLAAPPAATAFPYLPGVARLDRFWTEAHIAADADVLSPEALASIPSDSLFDLKLRLHPSARLGWFVEPSPSIWRSNRPPATAPERLDLDWLAEGALIARPLGEVTMLVLDASGFAFLQKCLAGATVGQALIAALEIDSAADLKTRIAQYITFGAFMPVVDAASNQTGDHE
jgi:hypothetical protein